MIVEAKIQEIVRKVRTHEWMVPTFQREFVWTVAAIRELGESLCRGRPIGMVTVWVQKKNSVQVELRPISLPNGEQPLAVPYLEPEVEAPTSAILDGRQRCTAMCCLFAAFHTTDQRRSHSTRYFLDLNAEPEGDWVVAVPVARLKSKVRDLSTDAGALSAGFAPLFIADGSSFLHRAMELNILIRSPSIYPKNIIPGDVESRAQRLQLVFGNLMEAVVPYYAIPAQRKLSDICDIFESLNTTGTRVSTVDLLHSILFSDSEQYYSTPFLLREFIKELGKTPSLERFVRGWAEVERRPELVLQMVTACWVGSESPSKPGPRGGTRIEEHTSIKAADLLATPVAHWLEVKKQQATFAGFIRDFQACVLGSAGASFSWDLCPYPAIIAVYLSLRWHREFDPRASWAWDKEDLDVVFRAFFWRNALSERYNQGFLTEAGKDVQRLKGWLNRRSDFPTQSAWLGAIEGEVAATFEDFPPRDEVCSYMRSPELTGALRQAALLPLVAFPKSDLLSAKELVRADLGGDQAMDLHHVFPRAWFAKNLDSAVSGHMRSVANLMPLGRKSNLEWRDKRPSVALKHVTYANVSRLLDEVGINQELFDMLKSTTTPDDAMINDFVEKRAEILADRVLKLSALSA